MDSITHTLFGATIYSSLHKEQATPKMKKALLFTSIVGSQIPDIDVISKPFDTQGLYQMWHRGITHSVLFVPIWALLISIMVYSIWRMKDRKIFYLGMGSVFLHITSDLFNAWGTGYLEPFSSMRISFGTIPIIDFVVWILILGGYLISRLKKYPSYRISRMVLLLIMVHFLSQSVQGYFIYQSTKDQYDKQALSASFLPGHFQIFGKKGEVVEISKATIWNQPTVEKTLYSHETADLQSLFKTNPRAKTLYSWSPFVVVVDNEQQLGVFDPRFYRNGESFLYEYIDKTEPVLQQK